MTGINRLIVNHAAGRGRLDEAQAAARHQQAGGDAGEILAHQGGEGEQHQGDDERQADCSRWPESPRISGRGQALGLRRGPPRRLTGLDPIEEVGQGRDQTPRGTEHHEVVGDEYLEPALGHQTVVLESRGDRHQHIAPTMHDQYRLSRCSRIRRRGRWSVS